METQPFNIDAILKLPLEDRIHIVEHIWDSIVTDSQQLPLTAWQMDELDKRMEAIHQMPTEGASWQDVKRRIQGES